MSFPSFIDSIRFTSNSVGLSHPSLDQGLASCEKVLNIAGYVPIVSNVSGALRLVYGEVEVVAAVAVGVFLILKALFNSNAEQCSQEVCQGRDIMVHYALHGLGNICRGSVESLFFIGNLSTLFYDFVLEKRFAYASEVQQ